MDDVVRNTSRPKPGRYGLWILIAILVLCPEVAIALYFVLCVILAIRMNWLFHQGLNDLRRRYRS